MKANSDKCHLIKCHLIKCHLITGEQSYMNLKIVNVNNENSTCEKLQLVNKETTSS